MAGARRRSPWIVVGLGGALMILAAGAVVAVRVLRERPCTHLGAVAEVALGEVRHVECAGVFVVNTDGHVHVLLDRSPPLGLGVVWRERRRLFEDPHGHTFDANGHHVSGGAAQGLWSCPTRVVDGELILDAPDRATRAEIETLCRRSRSEPHVRPAAVRRVAARAGPQASRS